MVIPPFLNTPVSEQKANFANLNGIESERINESFNSCGESEWSMSAAMLQNNIRRNRYSNVFPWDRTRVKLPVVGEHSDYINASYITLNKAPDYIASQGPLKETMHHFWSMCYHESDKQQNDTVIIAMVTPLNESGITKCSSYWPTKTHPQLDFSALLQKDGIDIPGLKVNYVSETYNEKGDFLLTVLDLISQERKKKVYHYYYYKWSDAKVPSSIRPLLSLSEEITTIKKSFSNEPVPIIHCSAGVGRTGTFIVLDQLLNDPAVSFKVDPNEHSITRDPILDIVIQLRKDRMMMVQTVYQYCFLYHAMKTVLLEEL